MKTKEELQSEINAVDSMMKDLFEKRMNLLKEKDDTEKSENYVLTTLSKPDESILSDYALKFDNAINDVSNTFLKATDGKTDGFLKGSADYSSYSEAVFAISNREKQDKAAGISPVYNATLGCLTDEEEKLVAFPSVYSCFNAVDNSIKAAYAKNVYGNDDFCQEIFNWINQKNNIHIPSKVVASPGGTGALSMSFANLVEPGQTVLIAKTSWGNYKTMAAQFNIKLDYYNLVDEDNKVDLTNLMLHCLQIIKKQHKLIVVVNDPCQNPTGISWGNDKWKIFIAFLNKLTEYGKVILINDVAYIDFSYNDPYEYMQNFNDMNKDCLAVITYSCSKVLSAYGMRLGAAIILGQDQQEVENVFNAYARTCRGIWSNVNNGLMHAYVDLVLNHKQEFLAEKQVYVDLLKQRSDIFMKNAKEVGLPVFPYSEGFFITIHIEDTSLLNRYHQRLMDKHIYTVKFTEGIRLAICSLPVDSCEKLPALLMEALQECKND